MTTIVNTVVNNTYQLGLSSNINDRFQNLQRAIDELNQIGKVKKISEIYETEPYGYSEQNDFLNIAATIETELEPVELIIKTQEIEHRLGRKREIPNGPRTIDIDILLTGDKTIKTEALTIPHKEMHKRDFVLIPLCEIAADDIHPTTGKSIRELQSNLKTNRKALKWTKQKLKI